MDTNPFANNNQQMQTPDYLKTTNNPTMTGAAANMIKALIAGNQQYQARNAGAGGLPPGSDGTWMGNNSVGGAPLSGYSGVTPQMPTNPGDMQGGVPVAPPMPMPRPAFGAGAAPVTMDPISQALMSPIPGMNNG